MHREVKLSIFAYILFHEDFSPINGTVLDDSSTIFMLYIHLPLPFYPTTNKVHRNITHTLTEKQVLIADTGLHYSQ